MTARCRCQVFGASALNLESSVEHARVCVWRVVWQGRGVVALKRVRRSACSLRVHDDARAVAANVSTIMVILATLLIQATTTRLLAGNLN